MSEIVIYTRDFCGFCGAAKNLLSEKGLTFKEVNASYDSSLRQEMIERAGGKSTFPQIFIGEQHIGGCDDLFALNESGELTKLVEAKED